MHIPSYLPPIFLLFPHFSRLQNLSAVLVSSVAVEVPGGNGMPGASELATDRFVLIAHLFCPSHLPLGVNPDEDISHLDGVAAIWNINNPQAPHTLQVCDGALTCGCWSAKRGYLFFCGSKDGAVYVWDQREPEHMHSNSIRSVIKKNPKGRNSKRMESLTPRAPTYSTEWMWKENHQAPIVRILPVGYNCKSQGAGVRLR